GFRPDPVPHAAVRLRHGGDHGVAAARADRDACALVVPEGAQGDRRHPGEGRARLMGAPAEPLLTVEHLSMRFGGLVAVNDLSFAAGRGEITALIGPTGAGKPRVFNCATVFYKPPEGRISLVHGAPALWGELDALPRRGARSLRRPDGTLFLLERMPDYLVAQRARIARTFQNIR